VNQGGHHSTAKVAIAVRAPGVIAVRTGGNFLAMWLLLLGSIACELGAFFALYGNSPAAALLGFLGLHFGSAGLASESLRVSARRSGFDGHRPLAAAGACLCLFFPAVGQLVVFYLVVARPVGRRSHHGKESLEDQRARAGLEAMERKRAAQQVGGQVHSTADALKSRDKEVRIAAVESLRGEKSQKAVQFLAASQMNTVFDVRVRAIENLNLLRDQFRKSLAESRQNVLATENNLEAMLDHSKLCLENAELGIEDAEIAKGLFEEAHSYARQVSAIWASREVLTISASALRALGRHEEAEFEYAEILKQDRTDMEAILGQAEMQFLRRDFTSLRNTCRLIIRTRAGDLEPELQPVMRMWLKSADGGRASA
jgi:tetratricopeptide (TPR) repeat protein